MLIKHIKFILLFIVIILFSSCSQKEINQKDYIIQDINVIKSQLNEINSKSNLFELSYKDLNNYNNKLLIELNTSNNQKSLNNKFLLKLDNEFVLFKNKIIDTENKFSKINEFLLKETNNKKYLDINKIQEELLLIKENLLKINNHHVEQISILKSQYEKLVEIYKNTYDEKNNHLIEKVDKITKQLETYENSIFNLNNYLKNHRHNKKQIKSEFLIVLVGFYGALIAFLIPHGIDSVSKIGKRYESERIANIFRKKAFVKSFRHNLILGITINVFLIIYFDYILIYLLILPILHFLIIICFVVNYIHKLEFYNNTEEVLNSIQEDIINEIQ